MPASDMKSVKTHMFGEKAFDKANTAMRNWLANITFFLPNLSDKGVARKKPIKLPTLKNVWDICLFIPFWHTRSHCNTIQYYISFHSVMFTNF